jgi:hypothetical protein
MFLVSSLFSSVDVKSLATHLHQMGLGVAIDHDQNVFIHNLLEL